MYIGDLRSSGRDVSCGGSLRCVGDLRSFLEVVCVMVDLSDVYW